MLRIPLFWLGVSLVLFASSGASCPWMLRQPGAPIPQILPPAATLDQVIAAVNDNTARARSGVTSQAYLTVPGAPRLAAEVAFETPRRFRLKGGTRITGEELDVGMNDELFWLWVRRGEPPAMYFCRHEQFATSSARSIMPVEPDWLVEALGLTTFQPFEEHQGPIPVGAGRLEIRTRRRTSMGEMTKVTVVDAQRALVLAQHLYDAQGQPIATALTSNHIHIRDGNSGVNMPRQIELQLPATQMNLRIDVVDWQINTLGPEHAGIWIMPDQSRFGAQNVDLANPALQFTLPGQPLTGQAIDPRANGGLRGNSDQWSAAGPAVIATTPGPAGAPMAWQEQRARLREQFAPVPAAAAPASAAPPVGSTVTQPLPTIAPPVVELPATHGPFR
jgi:hypothetical protein